MDREIEAWSPPDSGTVDPDSRGCSRRAGGMDRTYQGELPALGEPNHQQSADLSAQSAPEEEDEPSGSPPGPPPAAAAEDFG